MPLIDPTFDPCAVVFFLRMKIEEHIGIKAEEITSELVLLADCDSLCRVNLLMDLEDEYGLDLRNGELDLGTTYQELESIIIAKAEIATRAK